MTSERSDLINEIWAAWESLQNLQRGWVYVLKNRTHKMFKFGFTGRTPEARRKEVAGQILMQDTELVCATWGSYEIEQFIHGRCKPLRVSGDWYRPGETVHDCVLAIAYAAPYTQIPQSHPSQAA